MARAAVDDIGKGRFSSPSVNTASLDTPFIAHHAIARIAARFDNPDAHAVEVVAPHIVLVRESTVMDVGEVFAHPQARRPGFTILLSTPAVAVEAKAASTWSRGK